MKKKFNKTELIFQVISVLIYFASAALFIVGLVIGNNWMVGISGALIIFCSFALTIKTLTKKGRLSHSDALSVLASYLVIIIFACAFISSIKEQSFREVFTAVVSATLGGMLTLLGVGITIKYSRIDKREDEINRCKPRVFPISPQTWCESKGIKNSVYFTEWKTKIVKGENNSNDYFIDYILLATSDLSMCVYDGIIIDDESLWFDYGLVLEKNQNYYIAHGLRFKLEHPPKELYLLLTDMLDNTYKAKMIFETKSESEGIQITIKAIANTEMYIEDNKIR